MIDLLKNLISFDSSTREGANETLEFCRKWLNAKGLVTIIEKNNGFDSLVCEIGSGEKTLILNGHIDVVSAPEKQFAPRTDGNKLYGRGAADMKAGAAAMMCAMAELKDVKLPCKVMLQLVTDEETGGLNCSKYLVEKGYSGDFVIAGEPTNLGIGVQAKGIFQMDIEISGKSAHGSRPWEGSNAILSAYEVFNKILALPFAQESSELYASPSINLSKVIGGEVYNKVPDKCRMSLDIRFLPHQTAESILEQIKSIGNFNISIHSIGDPVKTSIADPCVELLKEHTSNVTAEEVKLFGQHGSADTRFYSKFGIPAVEFGPCGNNWHGDEEYVLIDSVESYKNILIDFAHDFK